jgi:hypothetical protein
MLLEKQGKAGDLIFASGRTAQPLDVAAVLKLMQALAPGMTVHGTRASFKMWCGDHGVPRELAELSLAHRIGNAVEQAYDRTALLERRRAPMQAWADHLDSEADAEKVVKIGGRKRK